jgi:uncharacterized membrane protein YdfJ with MMPL/SSD domain
MRHRRSFAAAAGSWSARHRWAAVGLWLLFVTVTLMLGSAMKPADLTAAELTDGEARHAQQILDQAGFALPAHEVVFVHSDTQTVESPQFKTTVDEVIRALNGSGQVAHVASPFGPGGTGAVSADQRSALISFDLTGEATTAKKRIQPVLDGVAKVGGAHPGIQVEEFGEASFAKAYDDKLAADYTNAEMYSLPVTLAILFIAFAALLAAILPVILAITAVVAAGGLVALTSHLLHVDQNGMSVMTLIGIAVGVDYSLFYIRRTREERARGLGPRAAVEAAAATSGRAVVVSGAAVMIAMAGMFLSGNGIQMGMAEATIVVVAVAVLGSITVLPAVLSLLGDRIDKGRLPLRRKTRREPGSGLSGRLVAAVLRRPWVSVVVATAALGALVVPALSLHTSDPGFGDLPENSMPSLQTYARIQAAFPGTSAPAKIVIKSADISAPTFTAAIDELRRVVAATPELSGPVIVQPDPARGVALVTVGLAGNGTDDRSVHALRTLRTDVIPRTLGQIPGVTVAVAGTTASSVDTTDHLGDAAPRVVIFVLILTFVIMLLAFRSLVISAMTLVLNLLSVGAAYGVVVLVFQYGYGDSLLGFKSNGGITSWVPLFLFVILFGLSMDYHVFVVSRIREARDRGLSTSASIEQGIRRTAGVVTSAAVVMVAVAGVFGTLPQLSMKEAGVGLSAAVLIDATVIRVILLPAAMRLLGEANWYLPRWLGRLPAPSFEEDIEVPVVPTDQPRPTPARV